MPRSNGSLSQVELESHLSAVSSLEQQLRTGTDQIQQLRQQLEEKNTQVLESSHHAQGLASQLEDLFTQKVSIGLPLIKIPTVLKTSDHTSFAV